MRGISEGLLEVLYIGEVLVSTWYNIGLWRGRDISLMWQNLPKRGCGSCGGGAGRDCPRTNIWEEGADHCWFPPGIILVWNEVEI